MYYKRELGIEGECFAVNYLKSKGYKIVDRNFMCYYGEIDIIAKDNNEYVFIEVKTRKNFNYGIPSEAVDRKKIKHIYKSAKYYTYINKLENKFIRFDVIEIYKKNNKLYLNHIKQIV